MTTAHAAAVESLVLDVAVLWPYLELTEKFQWVSSLRPLLRIEEMEIASLIEKRVLANGTAR